MTLKEIKSNILSGKYDKEFLMLYGETEKARKRYCDSCDEFESLYGDSQNIRIFSAPGRTEVGGNHTDHQHGSVVAGGVDMDVIAIVSENDDNTVRVKSKGYDMDVVNVGDFEIKEKEIGRAISLIRGICYKFTELGYKLSGFNAYTTSNVLKGSGLSSSAAFETLLGNIMNGLFANGQVTPIEIAKIGQFAERDYFGKPCGLLDQMASSIGGFTYADFNNPAEPITEKINLNIKDYGYTLCVVDTGGNHANLTQDYADITIECKQISNALGVEFLRDADVNKFYENMAKLRKDFGERAVLRAFHFFNEHQSSFDYLQNLYSTTAVKDQGLSLAIALTKQFLGDDGACRVHGGGFAGTIQCYIPTDRLAEYKAMIEKVYGENTCSVLSIRPVGGYELML